MNLVLQKLFTGSMTPEDKDKTMQEARECLRKDPDLLKRFDDMFDAFDPGAWDFGEMRKPNTNASASGHQ